MKQRYTDILSRIGEEPTWHDENGTPRYGVFHPEDSPDIYAMEVCLLEILCQSCQQRFEVEMHSGLLDEVAIGAQIPTRGIHYGDPPSHNCTGDTMNSEPHRILQFWRKDRASFTWVRVPELEVDVIPNWVKETDK